MLVRKGIFPWEIKEYAKIGITNFKLVGRDGYRYFEKYVNGYAMYLKGIENVKSIENYPLACFVHHINMNSVLKKMSVKHYKKYLPKIEYFMKYGHLCASRCGVECKYCYKCAKKIESIFSERLKTIKKEQIQICI